MPIPEEDRHITTFITQWGRFRYKLAPQGFLASGDAYNQRFDAIITLNPKKFQFAQDTVDFAGLIITHVKPSSNFLDAMRDFSTPKDISGARGWFGRVNKCAYAFSMTKQMKPFRHLIKPSTKFSWTDELDAFFQKSKEVITNEMKEEVRLFDPARPTSLSKDWSIDGVGFSMSQKYCTCTSKTAVC